uniref:Uncharacterized protein n=1 Tax=Octopus bimaculoides TaxID=37653 RepID=A0A0L8G7W9_OCTBM
MVNTLQGPAILMWLSASVLKSKTEGFIIGTRYQCPLTGNYQVNILDYLIVLLQLSILITMTNSEKKLYWFTYRQFGFLYKKTYREYKPVKVVENKDTTDFCFRL